MSFSEAFKQLLAEKGIKQADFARATGWSTGYIADMCTGRVKDPSLKRAQVIAEVLGISLQELADRSFGGDAR